jgi:hypothetical protein
LKGKPELSHREKQSGYNDKDSQNADQKSKDWSDGDLMCLEHSIHSAAQRPALPASGLDEITPF